MATNSPDRRSDRPDMTQEPTAEPPGSPDDDPITLALRASRHGTAQAGAALSQRARQVVWVVVTVFALSIAINLAANVYLYAQATTRAVEAAEQARTNGAAQEQARRALADAEPAQTALADRGLFRLPLPSPRESPAFEVIANSASAQVLADMSPTAIVTEDYVAMGAAVNRFYQRQPTVTQSGPSKIKVSQLCQQYMQVASELQRRGVLKVGER